MQEYNQTPKAVKKGLHKNISTFMSDLSRENADENTIRSFGEEWSKFNKFTPEEIKKYGDEYFDIVTDEMLNSSSYVIDIGCGSGRWTQYLHSRSSFIEAVDPSSAIFSADILLKDVENVRLTQASVDNLPFEDNTFDFGMSIGVLHHIPDTKKAMQKCVEKIKPGGYFYVYLYYNLENRGFLYRSLFFISNFVRRFISTKPASVKKFFCDIIAFFVYLPIVLLGRIARTIGFSRLANKFPLLYYQDKSIYVIRTDALDRFGTPLEHRFSKDAIIKMMKECGLTQIIVSDKLPYYHAVGKKR